MTTADTRVSHTDGLRNEARERKERLLTIGKSVSESIGGVEIFVWGQRTVGGAEEFVIIKKGIDHPSYLLILGQKDEVANTTDAEKVRAKARYVLPQEKERILVGEWVLIPIDVENSYIAQDMRTPEEYLNGNIAKRRASQHK